MNKQDAYEENKKLTSTKDSQVAIYELSSIISHISDPAKEATKHNHLIVQARITDLYKDSGHHEKTTKNGPDFNWLTLNDFVVTPCSEKSACDFSWKNPAVISYTRLDNQILCPNEPVRCPITSEVFFTPNPIRESSETSEIRPPNFVNLTADTLPKTGDLIALDSEFVALAQEVIEIQPDGSSIIVNPMAFSLAHVAVLRPGKESQTLSESQSLPEAPNLETFIDDYIAPTELVVDYLTKYSGLRFKDLDPLHSKYYVTNLKVRFFKKKHLSFLKFSILSRFI